MAARDSRRNKIVYEWEDSAGGPPLSDIVEPDSLASAVFASDDTVVRGEPGAIALGVPIRFGNAVLGAICLDGIVEYHPEDLTLLESCALYLGARIYYENTLLSSERYAALAFTDGLTGVPNRRKFDDTLAREWARALRNESELTLLMIDIDYFKAFNDSYGHHAGDLCLQHVARTLADGIKRPADLFARYGGEEFVALLPGTELPGATVLAEALRGSIAELGIAHAASSLGSVSVSVGIASVTPRVTSSADALLQAADAALYRAKLAGRNRVFTDGYESDTEPAQAITGATANNLPLQNTRLIGRKAEITDLKTQLHHHRIVSVVGGGGTGKTRVALHVAVELLEMFPDGVWFVDYSALSDPTLVAATTGDVLGARVSPRGDGNATLARAIGARRVLLVLDNCEQVVTAVAQSAAALLRLCPNVSLLTTSREPLGIAGEDVYRLPLLALPDDSDGIEAAVAIAYDAVALFAERAKAADRAFVLTDENAPAVIEICRRLDGIALAIELAAARLTTMGPAELARLLREHFALLTGSDHAALPRRQTMRALIDWSHDLLDERERIVFRRLAIFAGGWRLDAASDVCTGDGVAAGEVFDVLAGLIRKSLVISDVGSGESRYRLLDSTRFYAREKLIASMEDKALARRHAEHFLRTAQMADAAFRTSISRDWLATRERDIDNVRAALHWALTSGNDVKLGAALVASLSFFLMEVHHGEGVRWIDAALAALEPGKDPQIEARLQLAVVSAPSHPAAQLRAAGERAVELYRALGDRLGLAEALRCLGQILGWYFRDERAAADAMACESIEIARSLRDPLQIAMSLRTRGLTIDIADFPQKRAVLEESLALLKSHGNDRHIGSVLTWLSDLEFSAGDEPRAYAYGREAIRYADASGSHSLRINALANLALYAAAAGDRDVCHRAAKTSIALWRETGNEDNLTSTIQALAIECTSARHFERAARLLGFCDAHSGVIHTPRQADQSEDILYRRAMEMLRAKFDPLTLRRIMAIGALMTDEMAIAEALPD